MKFRRLTDKQYITYVVIILFGIGTDQLTKLLSEIFLTRVPTVPLWEGVLHLTYVENTGAAFGMLKDSRWVFLVVSFFMLAVLIPYLFGGLCEGKLSSVAVSMVISGGIGNMIDRLSKGYVVDFIDVRLIHFAVFNVADSFVCVGAGLLILALLLGIADEEKKKKVASPEASKKSEER